MKWWQWVIPTGVAVLLLAALGYRWIAPQWGQPTAMERIARLPVVHGGRTKPLDTFARNALRVISDKQTWRDEAGDRRPAIQWLLEVMAGTTTHQTIGHHAVFRIDNEQVLAVLELPMRKRFRYAFDEFRPKLGVLEQQADAAREVDPDQRDLYQRKIIELADHVRLFAAIVQWQAPLVVPPVHADQSWRSLFDASDALNASKGQPRIARAWIDTLIAWQQGDQAKLSEALNQLMPLMTDPLHSAPRKARAEWLFNQARPFGDAMALYVIGFVMIMFAWLLRSGTLRRTGMAVLIVTFVLHTLAIGLRVYLQGRPPVTNLYSSAVFVGWAACVLALVIEWLFRNGVGVAVACVVGFVTLLIADHLAGDGDTMQMMQAVLDSNFWLTTHVITVTLGYSATFLAGGIAVVFMLGAFFTPLIDAGGLRAFGRMIYGTICFALLLSFVGTVLGGIWADQSWGRFWGWDPKENGALMIVLWNALILHARWGGMVRQRGLATMAVFGMIITAWSWFGVNMLGAGLHSYGFMEGAGWYLRLFIAITLALTGIGMLPRKLWWSLAKLDHEHALRRAGGRTGQARQSTAPPRSEQPPASPAGSS